MNRGLKGWIQAGVIFSVVFTPLAFGSVYLWSLVVLAIAALAVLGLWLVKMLIEGQVQLVKTPFNLLALTFLGLAIIQLVPLPPGAIKVLAPQTYKLYQESLPGWPGRAAFSEDDYLLESLADKYGLQLSDTAPGSTSNWRSLSVSPYATKAELAWLLPVFALFFATMNNFRTRKEWELLALAVVITGFSLAFIGLIQSLAWNGKIYWMWQATKGAVPFGPYMNRNHFAGYIAMGLLMGLGLLWSRASRISLSRLATWRRKLAFILAEPGGKVGLLAFFVVMMASSLVLSLSRGGILSTLVSLMVFALVVSRATPRRGRKWLMTCLGVLAAVNVAWLGWEAVVGRVLGSSPSDLVGRLSLWGSTLSIFADGPVFGSGLGTYSHIIPGYQTMDLGGLPLHAENDYLQLLSETGVIGFGILALGLAGVFLTARLKFGGADKSPKPALTAGVFAGLLALLIHSLLDFNLHIPANTLLFSLLLAMFVAGAGETSAPRKRIRLHRLWLYAGLGLALPISLLLIYRSSLAEFYVQQSRKAPPATRLKLLQRALRLNPTKPEIHVQAGRWLAEDMTGLGDGDRVDSLRKGLESVRQFQRAVAQDPANPVYHLSLGWAYGALSPFFEGDSNSAWRLEGVADRWLNRALNLGPFNAAVYYGVGSYYLNRWQYLSGPIKKYTLETLRRSVTLDNTYLEDVINSLWEKTRDPQIIERALPDDPWVRSQLARFLRKVKQKT